MIVRKFLHWQGFHYRLHARDLPGKPDIVLRRYNVVIFVHRCFWHGHDCSLFKWPRTRADFWKEKIGHNQLNYRKAQNFFLAAGWWVGIIWECALRGKDSNIDAAIEKLAIWIRSDASTLEVKK